MQGISRRIIGKKAVIHTLFTMTRFEVDTKHLNKVRSVDRSVRELYFHLLFWDLAELVSIHVLLPAEYKQLTSSKGHFLNLGRPEQLGFHLLLCQSSRFGLSSLFSLLFLSFLKFDRQLAK